MSKRKNGTNRAAAALGLNPYGWGCGKARKRPGERQLHIGQFEKNTTNTIAQMEGDCKDGK